MRARVRSTLLTAGIVLFVIAGWLYLAPSQIGGSTTYVITSGTSMEPRFHSGDLALVRPLAQYRVGEIVAYHSSLLHVTVLHRIIAIHGGQYVFKGDNNNFIDPIHVPRADLLGGLWLHIPRGGVVLKVVHTPLVAALLIGVVAVLCLIGGQEVRRRRRGRQSGGAGASRRTLPPLPVGGPVYLRPWLLGAGAATAAFLALTVFALGLQTRKTTAQKLPFTQHMRFGYSATVAPGPVYPDGRVHTGEPIFLHLVRRIQLTSSYHLETESAHNLAGTEQLALAVVGPTGWTRQFPLGRPMSFAGVGMRTATQLDVSHVQALLARFQQLTGVPAQTGSSIELIARVHVHGDLGGRPLDVSFEPILSLQLQPLQLQPASAAAVPGAPASTGGFDQTKVGSVSVPSTASNDLSALGMSIAVAPLRALALIGLLLSGAALLMLAVLARLRAPFEESVRIRARYGHLIVPIVAAPDALDRVPFDVTSIEALVRLAESGERLILHHRDPVAETYLVSDDTGIYRYQVGPQRVVWGEWQPPRPPAGYEDPAPAAMGSSVPVAPPPSFLAAAVAEPIPPPAPDPPPGPTPPPSATAPPPTTGVPLSAYTNAPPPARAGKQLLSRAANRLARELVRGARQRRRPPAPPTVLGESGD